MTEFKIIADALMQAAIQTNFDVSLSRDSNYVNVVICEKELGKSTLYAVSGSKSMEYRILDPDDIYRYVNKDTFVDELQERFSKYGIDFRKIIERTAA